MSENNFKLLFQISQKVKFAKYFLVFVSIAIVYELYAKLGLNSTFGIIVTLVFFLFAFCFMMVEAFINFDKHKSTAKKNIILVGISIFLLILCFIASCIFFDYPQSLDQILNKQQKQTGVEPIGEPTKNIISFQIGGEFYDDCKYPFVYPDSICRAISVDSITKYKPYSDSLYEEFSKAPTWILSGDGYYGFYLPFHVISNNSKKLLILDNKFRVKVKVESIAPSYVNAGSTCAGDMDYHQSKDIVILSSEKSEYWKDIHFNKADFYTSEPNEQNSFEIYFKIKNPAIYSIVIEIPYFFNQKRYYESFKIPNLVVPKSYTTWEGLMPDNQLSNNGFFVWNGKGYEPKGKKKNL